MGGYENMKLNIECSGFAVQYFISLRDGVSQRASPSEEVLSLTCLFLM